MMIMMYGCMVKCDIYGDTRHQGIKQGEKCCEQSSDEDN